VESEIIQSLFLILFLALVGGVSARALKLPTLIGYILAGVIAGFFFPTNLSGASSLAEIGLILLLFSIGLELNFGKLAETGFVAVFGAILQIISITILISLGLILFGIRTEEALVLGAGFSLSSTALVVKILEDKAETNAIHGRLMISWLLTQDLAVIAMFTLLPVLGANTSDFFYVAAKSISASTLVLASAYLLGRKLVPFLIHKIASTNTRELLILSSVGFALGTALLVASFGISGALGAFVAGVVISESQEKHAIFAETRPLRDLFIIIFFATLGLFIDPHIFLTRLVLIIALSVIILLLKTSVTYFISRLLGYKGKTSWSLALGLSQIGEFSFVIFIAARKLNLLSQDLASIGASTALITLISTPFMFNLAPIVSRRFSSKSASNKPGKTTSNLNNHVVICGHGRVGQWVGKALDQVDTPYIIIDYDQKVISSALKSKTPFLYGDPSEIDILKKSGVEKAKAIVITIPDIMVQEEIISHCQSLAPESPIISLAHLNKDVFALNHFGVQKVVQPEFEGAASIVKELLLLFNKRPSEVKKQISLLRRAHTLAQK